MPKADFATQRQRVRDPDTKIPEGELVPCISVWLAPDAAQDSTPIKDSDRQQVLDGVVNYGNDLVVVIENKIGWGGVTERAASSDQSAWLSGQVRGETMLGEVAAVSRGLFDLVERDLVSGAEGLLISDFFDLVKEHFPLIGPYSTLARCGDNRFRVERRLDTILGEVVGTDVGKAKRERYLPGKILIPPENSWATIMV